MLELVERAGRELQGPRQLEWCQRLDLEWDNLRAALDSALGLGLGARTWGWRRRWRTGHGPDRQAEGRARLERVLAIGGAEQYASECARVVGLLAGLTLLQGDLARGTPLTQRALTAARAQSDRWLEVNMLHNQGMVKQFGGELADSEVILAEAMDLARRSDLRVLEAALLGDMASLALARGELESAEESLRAALRLEGLDAWSRAMTFNSLGDLLRARGGGRGCRGGIRRGAADAGSDERWTPYAERHAP